MHACKKQNYLLYDDRKVSIGSNLIDLIQSKNASKLAFEINGNARDLILSMCSRKGIKVWLTINYLNIGLSNNL